MIDKSDLPDAPTNTPNFTPTPNDSTTISTNTSRETSLVVATAGSVKSEDKSSGNDETDEESSHNISIPTFVEEKTDIAIEESNVRNEDKPKKEQKQEEQDDEDMEDFVPPPPPKYINSKLDGVRTRLLLNTSKSKTSSIPNSATSSSSSSGKSTSSHNNNTTIKSFSSHHQRSVSFSTTSSSTTPHSSRLLDEDLGSAATVLSNMRSSPFRLHDPTYNNNNSSRLHDSSSRPSSSLNISFKPVLKIKPEVDDIALFDSSDEENANISNKNKNQDHSIDNSLDNVDDEDDEGDEEDDDDKHKIKRIKPVTFERGKLIKLPSIEMRSNVTWNKNGRRLSAPDLITKRTKKRLKLTNVYNNFEASSAGQRQNNSLSSTSSDSPVMQQNIILQDPIKHNQQQQQQHNVNYTNENGELQTSNGLNRKISSTSTLKPISPKHNINPNLNGILYDEKPHNTRSRNGCWICRLRKKKCSEEKPHCYNCQRLNLDCFYNTDKPDFISDPEKKKLKLQEIKIKTREAKRNAMRKRPARIISISTLDQMQNK